jgi:hypothetical protein
MSNFASVDKELGDQSTRPLLPPSNSHEVVHVGGVDDFLPRVVDVTIE